MNSSVGLFAISKNRIVLGPEINRNSPVVGAKRSALHPRAGVLYNLIYRTEIGSHNARF